jgi:hypothetical protein
MDIESRECQLRGEKRGGRLCDDPLEMKICSRQLERYFHSRASARVVSMIHQPTSVLRSTPEGDVRKNTIGASVTALSQRSVTDIQRPKCCLAVNAAVTLWEKSQNSTHKSDRSSVPFVERQCLQRRNLPVMVSI